MSRTSFRPQISCLVCVSLSKILRWNQLQSRVVHGDRRRRQERTPKTARRLKKEGALGSALTDRQPPTVEASFQHNVLVLSRSMYEIA